MVGERARERAGERVGQWCRDEGRRVGEGYSEL